MKPVRSVYPWYCPRCHHDHDELIAGRCPACGDVIEGESVPHNTLGTFIRQASAKEYAAVNGVRSWSTHAMSSRLKKLAERDKWTCHLCGAPVPRDGLGDQDVRPTRDHLIPRSLGGTNAMGNLKLAHAHCNRRRGATSLATYGKPTQPLLG
jgi:5-methylcytosine-specific restriction endonuclease McrA